MAVICYFKVVSVLSLTDMIYYFIKVVISAILIVLISEIAKRNSFVAAVVASLPIISILAFFWIYIDTGDVQRILVLSKQIFWLVLPSLVLFVTLPAMLKSGLNFYLSMFVAMVLTALAYFILLLVLRGTNIEI